MEDVRAWPVEDKVMEWKMPQELEQAFEEARIALDMQLRLNRNGSLI